LACGIIKLTSKLGNKKSENQQQKIREPVINKQEAGNEY